MKFIIAVAVVILLGIHGTQATPSHINNQATEATPQVAEVVQPTIQSEAPTPIQETLPEQTRAEETTSTPVVTEPLSTPKEIARATLVDLGYGDAWYAVEYIGFKESSWNNYAVNSIGACGLFQALPCSKMDCELSDVACQVRWATNYAVQRYGSWHQAYNFWRTNNWW